MALDRIVALVDMDCFYVQVERRQNPELKGKPCAVVQYKAWKGGAIIAVSYEARRLGVTRHMRGDEAKEKCPDIALVRVPEARGKANLIHYREAGAEVIEVLSRFCESCERASVDEAYFDLTENVKIRLATMSLEEIAQQSAASTVIEGFMIDDGGKKCVDLAAWQAAVRDDENIKRLAIGAIITSEMRAAVLKETQFTCSAGVAHNKMLAKLCGGLHKPDQQTLLPHCAVPKLFESVPIRKVRNLGGKLGHDVSCTLKAVKMSDIARFSLSELQGRLGDKTGEWLHYLGKGIDHEPVRPRQLAKSTGCSKNFPGKSKLDTGQRVKYWLDQLAGELSERLERESELNKRVARLLTVGVRTETDSSFSRSCQLKESSAPQMAAELFNLLLPFNTVKDGKSDTWHPAILTLNISASRFEVISDQNNTPSISAFFHKKNSTQTNFCRLETELHSSANSSDGLQQDQGTDGLSSGIELEDLNACRGDDRALHSASKEDKILKDKLDKKSGAKGDNKASTFKKGIESFFPGSNSRAAKNNAGVIKSIDLATVTRSSRDPYRASEIDVTVLESLPEDIRQEITLSLKRGKEVVQTAARGGTERESFLDNGIDYCVGDASSGNHPLCEEIVDDSELIQCQKCERTFSKCEMPEHLDYHFALDLQKGDRQLRERDPCNEPPKKKPRTTIRSFFSPKKAF